jgi:hypothetical protein
MVTSGQSKIPIFLEARELNDAKLMDFEGMIMLSFKLAGFELSKEQAIDGLKSGIFSFIFDGFDELRRSQEYHYGKQIQRAIQTFKSCPIVVSGRPNERMYVSEHLHQCDILPLSPEESVHLVQKLEFDARVKSAFISIARDELFQSHKEFLELPLLCVVMLITYSDSGRISKKKHEFYEDAFNALWGKHDARKQAGFEREKYTGLDKQSFLKLLSAFCASSYIDEDFSMREEQLRSHLKRATLMTGITVNELEFIRDMSVSTSLMVLDGNNYKFSHRSFQEYFGKYVLDLAS